MIREYRTSDLDSVLHVWTEASEVAHPFLTPSFLAAERTQIRDVYMSTAQTWVYELTGEVVGFIALVGNEVGGLFVRPDRQRLGVGWALLDTARDTRPVLEVEVFKENPIGRAFYAKYGFQVIKESTHPTTGRPIMRLRYDANP